MAIDESCGEDLKKFLKKMKARGVRSNVIDSFNFACGPGILPKGPHNRISELGFILRYTMDHGWSTKKRFPMNVEELANKWIDAIAKMSTSHTKDGYDEGDHAADELLMPLLKCPVAQVREFYSLLLEKMKADERIPFLVYIGYEAWGEASVKGAADENIKRLKVKLAKEIADLVEEPAAQQIPRAIARALMWRDEEQLVEVRDALKGGAKPKIEGRQSCLFLKVRPKGKDKKEVSVMI